MDSPGHCAQYCTYTVMDAESLAILDLVIIDKRMVGDKSTNMEREGFRRVLQNLLVKGVNVVEVVTDQHPQLPKFLSMLKCVTLVHVLGNVDHKISAPFCPIVID